MSIFVCVSVKTYSKKKSSLKRFQIFSSNCLFLNVQALSKYFIWFVCFLFHVLPMFSTLSASCENRCFYMIWPQAYGNALAFVRKEKLQLPNAVNMVDEGYFSLPTIIHFPLFCWILSYWRITSFRLATIST